MSQDNKPTLKQFNFFVIQISYLLSIIYLSCHLKGYRLDTVKMTKYIHAKSGLDCILQCVLQEILCRSVNFRNPLTSGGEENCELLKTVDSEEPPGSLKKDENFDYYKLLQPERVSTVRIFLYTECMYKKLDQFPNNLAK